ncbi:nitronate monooxygenase, partial [Pseudomonas sp. MWU13-2860]
MASALCRRWQLQTPLIQAPMAGGATSPALVAAVSQAGALGFLAAAMLPPERLLSEAAEVRKLTDKPFGINLFVQDDPVPSPQVLQQALEWLAPLHQELGLPTPQVPERFCEPFARQ